MSDKDPLSAPGSAVDVLRDRLDGSQPLDRALGRLLPDLVAQIREELLSPGGPQLGELLLRPDTSVTVLRAIKNHGKKLAGEPAPPSRRAAATTIYFAAIASACVHHGEKISKHAYAKLAYAFAELRSKTWMEPKLAALFDQAFAVCRLRSLVVDKGMLQSGAGGPGAQTEGGAYVSGD